jgi:hypothetical protein
MKPKRILTAVVWPVLGVCIVLIIWKPLVDTVFVISQGQDPRYDMGDGYEIWGPARNIIYWRSKKDYQWERIVHPERVLEFALVGPWLLGRTEKGWFAINKKTHDLNYPCSSRNELERITALDISSLHFITHPRPYQIVYPRTERAVANVNRLCWILLFVVPLALAFAPYAWRGVMRRHKP